MFRHVFRRQVTYDDHERFVIAPHHPDRLRRPLASPAAAPDERFRQALVWNVFRTLELITPSFWLRRFHLHLTGEATLVPSQIAQVHLWRHLPLPPMQRLDGDRPGIVADVVIETEHAVWTLVAAAAGNDLTDSERAAAVADAAAWFAGARPHACGVIESTAGGPLLGPVLRTRYARSRDSALLRSATRGPAAPTRVQWGSLQWPALTGLLRECCDADHLPPIERALAGNALEWLTRAGVRPDDGTQGPRRISG